MKNEYQVFMRKIIPILIKNGWVEVKSKNHQKFRHIKSGKFVTFGCTPSDQNAQRMSFRHIRSIDKETAAEIEALGLY